MNLSLAVVLLLGLSGGPAAAQSAEGIENELAGVLKFSTARIEFVGSGDAAKQPSCSGVLVGPNVVLTAAHCWGNAAKESRSADTISFHGASGKAAAFRRFDGYAGNEENDLALLAFDASQLKDRQPAKPLYSLDGMNKGAVVIVGSGGPGRSAESGLPQTARLRVDRVDKEKGLAYASVEKGAPVCWTDSGSPVFLVTHKGARLAGIVARPNGADCKPSDSVVIALLAGRESWLTKNIEAVANGKKADGGSTWGRKPP